MKSIIIYYSYNGNTKMVAGILAQHLKEKGNVDLIELNPLDESRNFFAQAARAFKHQKAEIEPVNFDLSSYDLICFGTPVWAFGPAPAMNTYLEKCLGVAGKETVLFTTYGSGAGKGRCTDFMRDLLAQKGAKGFKVFSVQQIKVKDRARVLSEIQEKLRLSPLGTRRDI